jgi:plasmid stabilization system protein ParE
VGASDVRVRWVRRALQNLDEEAAYIAQFDRQAATRMVGRLQDACKKLAAYPAIGRPGRVPGTRELVVSGTPYILPYRVRYGTVEILRVFHAARRWPKIL